MRKAILLSLFAMVLVFGLGADVSAQKKRKKAKAPLPMPTPVARVEPAVVSRAADEADLEDFFPRTTMNATTGQTETVMIDAATGLPVSDGAATAAATTTTATTVPPVSAESADLARQVRELTGKIESIDAKQKMLLDLQILSSAEQRAENLRKQLLDLSDKEATVRPRLEQIEYEIRPEVIERNAAFIGSLRPEEVRESMRKKLAMERDRLNAQLVQIQTNRTAIEASLQSADGLVTKLRTKLESEIEAQLLAPPPAAKKP